MRWPAKAPQAISRAMSDAPIEVRRKRLRFRAARRGFKEADAIFGAYAERHLSGLDEAELDSFEALLNTPDQEVYDWLRGYAPVPPTHDTTVFRQLRAICSRQNPTWNV
jgi:antitoxin CptB